MHERRLSRAMRFALEHLAFYFTQRKVPYDRPNLTHPQ
jgi:hypothetical protein